MNVRDEYFTEIQNYIRKGEDIVVLSCDLGAPSLDNFRVEFPGRFINVGVAEQNLVSLASGLSASGKKVIAWGLNPFIVTRTLDQILNTVSLMNTPFTLAGLQVGLSSAISGSTHVNIRNIGLLSYCPGLITVNPSDVQIARKAAALTANGNQAFYIQFDKDINYELYLEADINFETGFSVLHDGTDVVIVSTGIHTKKIVDMISVLECDGISVKLIDVYSFPFDYKKMLTEISNTEKIITVEEHVLNGGLGGSVLELLADNGISNIKVKRLGIDIKNGYPNVFAGRDYMERLYGLDKDSVKKTIIEFAKG